ncbi:MAG: pilus assembly protein [Actinomycetota bacterium]|nr:pilus assembly protein [Actinomycetota bacterium]
MSRLDRSQRGTALVEFALVLPFLALLSLTSVDFGRAYSLQHRLANGAREGAAFAQYFPGQVSSSGACADPENITYHALGEEAGAAAGFAVSVTNVDTGGSITGPCIRSGIAPGTRVKVTLTSQFRPITPFATDFVGSVMSVRRSVQVIVQG